MTTTTKSQEATRRKDKRRLLLIDDEAGNWAGMFDQGLRPYGYKLSIETRPDYAATAIREHRPHIILLDLHFPGDDRRIDGRTTGGALLSVIRGDFSDIPVVVFTTRLADASIPLETFDQQPTGWFDKNQISAMQDHNEDWAPILAKALNQAIDAADADRRPPESDMGFVVGSTRAMQQVAALVRNAAAHTLTVSIYGETGTGKQGIAEAIHRLSGRRGRFEHLNCSGVSEDTVTAQLFGHAQGAYNSPATGNQGLFELANGGTLFLDEIQAIPRGLQYHLMTVLEKRVVRRMGDDKEIAVDVRVIVATTQPLAELVADEVLREHLAYRFNQFSISLPPLRERMQDLEALCQHLIRTANTSLDKQVTQILRPEVNEKLRAHTWPGNIRELQFVIERAVTISRSNVLLPEDILISPLATRNELTGPQSPVNAGTTCSVAQPTDAHHTFADSAANYATQVENMPIYNRYAFVLNNLGDELRKLVLIEIVRRLRNRQLKKVQHKQLANFLDPVKNPAQDYERVRQMVISAGVQLTKLDFNQ